MGSVFRPRMPNGGLSPHWYARWQVNGRTKKKKIGTKAAAQSALAKFEDQEARRKHGLPDPSAEAQGRHRPLFDWLDEYLALLASRDTSSAYRTGTESQLRAIFAGCDWQTFTDIEPDALIRFLAQLRDTPRPRTLGGAAKVRSGKDVADRPNTRGAAPATLNGYLRAAMAFAKWLAEKFGLASPLRGLKPYPEEVDRRRSTRTLSDAELTQLLTATEAARHKGNAAVRGPDRAMLYRLAAYTGLRAGELAELTPAHFSLDAAPPVVTVAARDAKGKREEPIPLPDFLVSLLRDWLGERPRDTRLFPGGWAKRKHQARWLAADLKRAGIEPRDDAGRPLPFHSLKRSYVVRLIKSGAKIHHVRRLARHTDVKTTLNYYAPTDLTELNAVVNALPPTG